MLDRLLAPPAERALNRWAVLVLQSGMTPNRPTIAGFAFALSAAFAAGMQAYAFALLLFLLGRLFDHILAKNGQRVTIVGATSGDTGSAAIEAWRRSSAFENSLVL